MTIRQKGLLYILIGSCITALVYLIPLLSRYLLVWIILSYATSFFILDGLLIVIRNRDLKHKKWLLFFAIMFLRGSIPGIGKIVYIFLIDRLAMASFELWFVLILALGGFVVGVKIIKFYLKSNA
jgi:hypothetical protein